MTADDPEAPICPDCGKPARCVLEVNSIGTGETVTHGTAHWEPISEPSANWRIFVH